MTNPVIPEAAVEAAWDSLWNSGVDDRPATRGEIRAALEAAAAHMTDGMEWAVFRAQGGPGESPVENFRYKTRESAQAAIDSGYSQPQYWEPRGRKVGEWAK